MKLFLLILAVVAVCVFGLCFNIIFRGKPFPDGEISHNKALRKQGIICAKEEELRIWKKTGKHGSGCEACGSFEECKNKIEKD